MARRSFASLESWSRYVGDDLSDDMQRAAIGVLREAAARGVGKVVDSIDTEQAVDTGALRQSVRWGPLHNGAILMVNAPHAPFIERGTRPHYPPIEPILQWVLRKQLANDDEEALQIARAICAKIAKDGTKPRYYFRTAMRWVNRFIDARMKTALDKL